MSKAEFSEMLNEQPSLVETVVSRLSLSTILGEIGTELGHQAEFGAHEMAAALFRGDAFVMYPKAGQESVEQTPDHGLPIEPLQRGEDSGREM